jgi:hypothetical protein
VANVDLPALVVRNREVACRVVGRVEESGDEPTAAGGAADARDDGDPDVDGPDRDVGRA